MNKQIENNERIVLLDKERVLRFDFNALALAEEKTGRNLMTAEGWGFKPKLRDGQEADPLASEPKRFNSQDWKILVWSFLVSGTPEGEVPLTIEEVGKHLVPGKVSTDIQNTMWELYLSQYSYEEDKENSRPLQKDGAGGGPSAELTSISQKESSGG